MGVSINHYSEIETETHREREQESLILSKYLHICVCVMLLTVHNGSLAAFNSSRETCENIISVIFNERMRKKVEYMNKKAKNSLKTCTQKRRQHSLFAYGLVLKLIACLCPRTHTHTHTTLSREAETGKNWLESMLEICCLLNILSK